MRLEVALATHAARSPGRPAIATADRQLSYGDLQYSVSRLAAGFYSIGVRPGDRVVFYLPNGVEFVQAFFALLSLGAVIVPVNLWQSPRELAFCCEDSGATLILCANEKLRAAKEVIGDLKTVVVSAENTSVLAFDELLRSEPADLPDVASEFDEALILYTSGTTGRPKGAVLTHANVSFYHGLLSAVEWGLTVEDRFVVATPLANRSGIGRLANALMIGASLYIVSQFDVARFVELVEEKAITVIGIVPTMCRKLIPELAKRQNVWSRLRLITVTGEAFPVESKKQLLALLPNVRIVSYYGLTEIGGVSILRPEEQFTHPASVGKPFLGVEVKVVDDSGKRVAPGTAGEILSRSGQPGAFTMMKRYHGRPEVTADSLAHGWFKTGDIGYQDADGYLYILDRKKDMIISGGFNIYSKEVEHAIMRLPEVSDAAVLGVPDETFGEAVVAFVELHHGAGTLNASTVIDHCRQELSSYKKPKSVIFLDTLPRNSVGKVMKPELAKLLAEGRIKITEPRSF